MVKRILWLWLITFLTQNVAFGQSDTGSVNPQPVPVKAKRVIRVQPDSLTLLKNQHSADSIKQVQDSLSMIWIKAPDPNRPNLFLDSLIDLYTVDRFDFQAWAKKFPKKKSQINIGKPRQTGARWVVFTILILFLFFAILKNAFSKELNSIIESFYSNRILSQINKEDMLFNSWPFLFLYLLFGLTIGMFLYLSGNYFQLTYSFSGFEWFLILSAIIVGGFTLKIIGLRIMGFFFGIQKIVREYITILYLSYFNAALVFLPLILAYSLTPARYAGIYSYLAIFIVGLIVVFQFIRAGANILSNYRFSKTYLIIYICALEVCPLLILIKALRF